MKNENEIHFLSVPFPRPVNGKCREKNSGYIARHEKKEHDAFVLLPAKVMFREWLRNFTTIFFVDFPSSSYRSALRNWLFQVSKDGKNWTSLYTHTDDNSLNEPGYDIYEILFTCVD